jgi:hypothetical protein
MTCQRKYDRYNCQGSADLTDGTNVRVWGHLGDICRGGFYVSTFGPLPVHTEVRFKVEVEGAEICGVGTVATSHPGVGMAVVFQELSPQYQEMLDEVIHELAGSASSAVTVGLRV